jgi:hypothetical protein
MSHKNLHGEKPLRSPVAITLRVLALAIVYFVGFTVIAAIVLPAPQPETSNADNANTFLALTAISLLNTIVIAYVVLRSRWSGWKLVLTLTMVIFSVTTLMPQIETVVFVRSLPEGFVARLFVLGFVFSAVFAPLAVLILGKNRSEETSQPQPRLQLSLGQWSLRLALIALIYVVVYFTFGYFIAWRSPAVRAYYDGKDPGSFLLQIRSVLRDTPWLPALQILRGLLWAIIAIPVIRMMKGQWWEAGLAVALLFGVVMNTQLFLPNPLMPYEVRMMHLLETTTSNFLFGWVLVWLLTKK